jgi:hypothetical protein
MPVPRFAECDVCGEKIPADMSLSTIIQRHTHRGDPLSIYDENGQWKPDWQAIRERQVIERHKRQNARMN